MLKYISYILAFLMLPIFAGAQNCGINFSYDNSGNRIKKYLCWGVVMLDEEDLTVLAEEPLKGTVEAATAEAATARSEASPVAAKINDMSDMAIFPNPTVGLFNIKPKGFEAGDEVFILNGQGQLMKNVLFGNGEFDISDFTSGVYYIIVVDQKGVHNTAKVIRH